MKTLATLLLLSLPLLAADSEKGFKQLFNGKDLTGWKVNEDTGTFTVHDGSIVANGPRSHCFYVGKYQNHTFKNFELRVDVMTKNNSNGGIYIYTQYEDKGWPSKGFEVQVNNTFVKDPRKSGGLYMVQDVDEATINKVGLKDDTWFTERIIAKGNNIHVFLNDQQVVNWTQPADWEGPKGSPGRRITPGTFALQGHDPGSTVYYKNIRVKVLK